MGWFDEADMPYSVVITKSDCVGKPQIVRFANEVCMRYHSQFHSGYGSQGPVVHISSSNKNTGIHELMASVDAEFAGGVYQEVQEDDDSANS
jgi:GTP-binding protein EngB required for normal cell division